MGSGARLPASNPGSATYKALQFGANFFPFLCNLFARKFEIMLPNYMFQFRYKF